jgi:hypothetical protein
MTNQCLICNSPVVLSKDAAQAITALIGGLDGLIRGFQESRHNHPPISDASQASSLQQTFNHLLDGLAAAHSNWATTQAFISDIRHHQFMEYECLCLRCGAKYDIPQDLGSRSE